LTYICVRAASFFFEYLLLRMDGFLNVLYSALKDAEPSFLHTSIWDSNDKKILVKEAFIFVEIFEFGCAKQRKQILTFL
jgi:hypothetical protein